MTSYFWFANLYKKKKKKKKKNKKKKWSRPVVKNKLSIEGGSCGDGLRNIPNSIFFCGRGGAAAAAAAAGVG